ncbi:ArsO family NAD(P)H-dependent flavin-containing monooxygenase [Gaopeijia maritima]|uniref:ArsO family NAD(P)H-dependent flavin-containing monooxygenase n=1 Tax=Gaopeijia maritima TaxID=3119007 RepID=UPI003870D219
MERMEASTDRRARRQDVVVIGGGQAGLALGYHLRRAQRDTDFTYTLLDDQPGPGGAWRHGWDSLRLFSPAEWSSLPGWPLPRAQAGRHPDGGAPEYPTRDDVLSYLSAFEARYELPVERPVAVTAVREGADDRLAVDTDRGAIEARAVISATGSWARPFVPEIPGREAFEGAQLHSAHYRTPAAFAGRRVLVIGGGNSGAQIAAEVSKSARVTWVTLEPPRFLPEEVDGRVLFDRATARYAAIKAGEDPGRPYTLADIVQVAPVREARAAGRLSDDRRPPRAFTPRGVVWPDGREESVDAVIWCTGFRPALDHLRPLGVIDDDGRVAVKGTRSVRDPRLWLVGYGSWVGFAAATLIGVGRSAKQTATEVAAFVGETG